MIQRRQREKAEVKFPTFLKTEEPKQRVFKGVRTEENPVLRSAVLQLKENQS